MQELIEKASEIQDIADMITEISEQTNMLSLNASIEASRAGENGRGFLVVADEIRKLAIQSQESATAIASILADLEDKAALTSEAVVALKETNTLQTELISSTKNVFEDLNEKMVGFTGDVGHIAQRISEIVDSNNKVIESITQISALSEQATANVEEVNSMIDINDENTSQACKLVNKLADAANRFNKYL
jgi:methyl-accepting chemotaxis protein